MNDVVRELLIVSSFGTVSCIIAFGMVYCLGVLAIRAGFWIYEHVVRT